MKPILSQVSKLDNVKSFDLPLSTCQDRCNYFNKKICYSKNNPRLRYKKKVLKNIRNLKLIRSTKFIKVLSLEILKSNSRKFRFFSNGQTENLNQLKKVLDVCKICKNVKFAIMINSEIQIIQLIQSRYKIPKNANLLLSNYTPNEKTPEFMINEITPHNIGHTQTTLNKKDASCQASTVKNGHCFQKGVMCEKCYNDKNITFMIHGKHNKKRILKNG